MPLIDASSMWESYKWNFISNTWWKHREEQEQGQRQGQEHDGSLFSNSYNYKLLQVTTLINIYFVIKANINRKQKRKQNTR